MAFETQSLPNKYLQKPKKTIDTQNPRKTSKEPLRNDSTHPTSTEHICPTVEGTWQDKGNRSLGEKSCHEGIPKINFSRHVWYILKET